MKQIETSKLTIFDVDETLVMFCPKGEPVYQTPDMRFIRFGDATFQAHDRHIQQLIGHKGRGHTIMVWSAGGLEWATMVIKELGLEDYVDYVMDKGHWLYDDNPNWPEWVYYPLEKKE